MLGRRLVGLEARRQPVEELAAPDQVVVGVVVRIGRRGEEERDRCRATQERDAGQLGPAPRPVTAPGRPARDAGREQRPRQRVLEERGVEHRVDHERDERRRDAGPARPSARAAQQQRQRRGEQREVERQPDHALLGRDRDRDRVRRGRRALARRVLRPAVLAPERARPVPDDRLRRPRARRRPRSASDAPARRVVGVLIRGRPRSGAAIATTAADDEHRRRRGERRLRAPPQRREHRRARRAAR